jgi:hypothetical protein
MKYQTISIEKAIQSMSDSSVKPNSRKCPISSTLLYVLLLYSFYILYPLLYSMFSFYSQLSLLNCNKVDDKKVDFTYLNGLYECETEDEKLKDLFKPPFYKWFNKKRSPSDSSSDSGSNVTSMYSMCPTASSFPLSLIILFKYQTRK